ncbi:SdiA-regulated domain-containing protein [Spirosoma pomorum]
MPVLKPIVCVALLSLLGCNSSPSTTQKPAADRVLPPFTLPYALNQPDAKATLPKELKEISGLTYYKNDQLLCVEDENAVVYVFDTKKQKIVKDFGFGGYGDFEGIEYVNGDIYALESNGTLHRFKPESTQINRVQTDLPKNTEVEGLGYNPKTNRLLIAVKKGNERSDKAIYSYDIRHRTVYKDVQLNDAQLNDAKIKPSTYQPSGIAVHPITGEWYILSSVAKRLIITNFEGKLIAAVPLDSPLFRQPEGICFAPNGDLYIASEGDGKKGYILTFRYKK